MVVQQIISLYEEKGGREYEGEGVSQLEHALQAATHAERAGAPPALVCAALLHDIGHLLNDKGDTPTLRGVDDEHQNAALPFLRGRFPAAVVEPIRLHVDAKRYLCAMRPGYFAALSDDSKRSLGLQGGIFIEGQAEAFISQAGADRAVRLRVWDDQAKTAGLATPPLAHFLERARRCALANEPAA